MANVGHTALIFTLIGSLKVQGSDGMVLNECFHGFVGCEAEVFVELCGGTVSFFGALPEQAVVVAKERSVLHLTLVLEDGVALEPQLLRRDWHGHFDMVDFPFGPCSTVHPYAAVLHPCFIFQLVDGGENRIGAYAVGAVRVGEVACHENLMGLHFAKELFDNVDIAFDEDLFLIVPVS